MQKIDSEALKQVFVDVESLLFKGLNDINEKQFDQLNLFSKIEYIIPQSKIILDYPTQLKLS